MKKMVKIYIIESYHLFIGLDTCPMI